eukprot:1482540-Pyramimonas_sp.AAC.1
MPGHTEQWRRMQVLGAWPDAETARLEPICIRAARSTVSMRLTNKATDARGLERRPWSYSFIYIVSSMKPLKTVVVTIILIGSIITTPRF